MQMFSWTVNGQLLKEIIKQLENFMPEIHCFYFIKLPRGYTFTFTCSTENYYTSINSGILYFKLKIIIIFLPNVKFFLD